MVFKSLADKVKADTKRGSILVYKEDTNDAIDTTGIVIDEDTYDTAFVDRDFDVRDLKNFNIQVINSGAQSIHVRILGTTKDHNGVDGDLADADFTETELAEEVVATTASSTLYNLDRTHDGTPGITAVRLQIKEVVAANPGNAICNIKGL